jgi:hypothetical protein
MKKKYEKIRGGKKSNLKYFSLLQLFLNLHKL